MNIIEQLNSYVGQDITKVKLEIISKLKDHYELKIIHPNSKLFLDGQFNRVSVIVDKDNIIERFTLG